MCKVAVITGAGKGLGLALTRKAVAEGYIVVAMTMPMTDGLLELAKQTNGSVLPYAVDVTDGAAIAECQKQTEQRFGHIDLLINNAGIWMDYERYTLEDPRFDIDMCYREFDVNAMGVLRVTKAFLPLLRKSEANVKAIVNLSSDCASYTPDNFRKSEYAYCMSKACVNIISNLVSNDLANTNIKVFSVFPGWMQTDMGYAGPGNPQPDVPPTVAAEDIFKLVQTAPKNAYTFCDRFGNPMA